MKKLELLKYGLNMVWEQKKSVFAVLFFESLTKPLIPLLPTVFSADIVNGIAGGKMQNRL